MLGGAQIPLRFRESTGVERRLDFAAKSGPIVLGVSEVDRAADVDVVQDVQNQQFLASTTDSRAAATIAARPSGLSLCTTAIVMVPPSR